MKDHYQDPRTSKPRIAVTMGDPAGIGPEIIVKALAQDEVREKAVCVVVGNEVFL